MPNSLSIDITHIGLSKLSVLGLVEPENRERMSFRRANFPFMFSMNTPPYSSAK
jgi:hypothetical protein